MDAVPIEMASQSILYLDMKSVGRAPLPVGRAFAQPTILRNHMRAQEGYRSVLWIQIRILTSSSGLFHTSSGGVVVVLPHQMPSTCLARCRGLEITTSSAYSSAIALGTPGSHRSRSLKTE